MGMLRKLLSIITCSLFIILSSCKTVTRVENTNSHKTVETLYNRRENSSIKVQSPSVNIIEELNRIGYVDMKVVNNKDTFNIKVTDSNIILDAIVSEKDFEITKKEVADEVSQVQVESKPVIKETIDRFTVLLFVLMFIFVLIIGLKYYYRNGK